MNTFHEQLALEYGSAISQTPVTLSEALIQRIKAEFSEREMVVLASTAAQVNYWAKLIKSLGVPAAGFMEFCPWYQSIKE